VQHFTIFTARRYAIARYMLSSSVRPYIRLSVCPSVRLSHVVIVRQITQTTPYDNSSFLMPKNFGEIPTGSPPTGCQIEVG